MDYVTNIPITIKSRSQLTMPSAADATSHLFFAYLRSLTMDSAKGLAGISQLPMSLQKLVQETDYPPESLKNMHTTTPRVLMIVDSVSPTPFALLRRANHFQYRDEDKALLEFSEYIEPLEVLTDECKRVLNLIASSNQSPSVCSEHLEGTIDASWSRFEDLGFSCVFDEKEEKDMSVIKRYPHLSEKTNMHRNSMGRPTTPSWAEFLSSGFVNELKSMPSPLALPPDLSLPPIEALSQSSQSHGTVTREPQLEPGELASIAKFYLDDAFWWVWISSLAREETPQRKAAFGRCALIETVIPGGRWILIEEKVKGTTSAPVEGAYLAEKKRFWGRSKRSKGTVNRKSPGKLAVEENNSLSPQNSTFSKTSLGLDPHARIQAAAARLHEQQRNEAQQLSPRVGRFDDVLSMKTSSVFTLQPMIMNEASPAMKWAKKYDKDSLKDETLAEMNSGRSSSDLPSNNQLASTSRKLETPSYSSQPVSPITLDSSQSSSIQQNSPNTSRFSTTPKFTKYQTNPPAHSSGAILQESQPGSGRNNPRFSTTPKFTKYQTNSSTHSFGTVVQEPQTEINHGDTQLTEARRSTDLKVPVVQPSLSGKTSKKSSSGNSIKKIFGRNKSHDSKSGTAPPQAINGRKALEGKKTGSSLVRSLSALRKKSITPSNPPSSAVSTSPASQTPEFRSAQNSPRYNERSRSQFMSETDSLSRVSTSEVQKAQMVFSSFDQGPLEDSPVPVPGQGEDTDESDVSTVSPTSQKHGDENISSPLRISSEITKQQREGLSSDIDDLEKSGEETIESRVARIKARVAQLTGDAESSEKPALSPSTGSFPT